MRVHFIGICGVGMSATALLMKEAGYDVSGSDAECYGPTGAILKNASIPVRMGYGALPEADEYVIGRNAKLNPEENEEVRAAHASGKPIRSFAEAAGLLTEGRPVCVVAGSYGKSTVTALLAHVLQKKGAGYLIGAQPLSLPSPAKRGEGLFVVEGDEYPSSHTDPRAKFLHFHPTDVILTSVVHDHVNVYPTFGDYQKPFEDLLALVPHKGTVVVCADEPNALALAEASGKTLTTYGLHAGMYQTRDITYGERTHFTLTKDGESVVKIETTLLGAHNIQNIVGVSAYVLAKQLLTPEELAAEIASFTGIRRRLDRVATSSIPVYEGFGSSYEKARSAIEAMLLHYPEKPLTIIFEPHTFGWRNRTNQHWYSDVFRGAGKVFVAAPATQGATTHDQLSFTEIMDAIRESGITTEPYDAHNPTATVEKVGTEDIVLILSSGDLEGSMQALIEAFENSLPAMKLFQSEFAHDYGSYSFGYTLHAALESGDDPGKLYADGFLPYSANPSRHDLLYMARSVRVPVAQFIPSSENRRVFRKFDGQLTHRMLTREEMLADEVFQKLFLDYFRARHGEKIMGSERLAGLLKTAMPLAGVRYEDKSGALVAAVFEPAEATWTHFWFPAYDPTYIGASLGMWLMQDAIRRAAALGRAHLYLGTAYGEKAKYKLNIEQLEFWDGMKWVADTGELKRRMKDDFEHAYTGPSHFPLR